MDISDNLDNRELLPIYYKFRFTFTNQDKTHNYDDMLPKWRTISKNLVNRLLEQYTITKLTGGVETLNKDGDRTYAHLHIHFDAVENKETIARYIKRYLKDTYEENTTGVKAFCLKPEAMLRSKDDFYQYPLKQNLNKHLCYGYTDDELKHLHGVANSTYLKVQQVRQTKMDKSDNSDTLFQRLKIYLDKQQAREKLQLLILATKFYVEEDKPINKVTIKGYVDNYMLANKLITYEDYWNQ